MQPSEITPAAQAPETKKAADVPTYHDAAAERYWQRWMHGNLREIGEEDGLVYYVVFYKDGRLLWKTSRSEINRRRDTSLKAYLDEIANAQDGRSYERVYYPLVARLTGKLDLAPPKWKQWWKTNGPKFVIDDQMLKDYETWRNTQLEYRRWQIGTFKAFIKAEQERLKIRPDSRPRSPDSSNAALPDTPENRKAVRDEPEAPLPTQPAALNLDAAAKMLTEKVGGKWEKRDDSYFGLILECVHEKEKGKYGGSYLVLQLPVEEAAKALEKHPYDFSVAVRIVGSNDRCTVIKAALVADPQFAAGIVKTLKLTATQPTGLNLDATAKMLTEKVGGKWEKIRVRIPDLRDILQGDVPIGDGKVHYLVFPFPLDEAGRAKLGAYANNVARRPGILGSNDKCTVLTPNPRSPGHEPVTQALGLMPTVVRLEDLTGTFDWNRMWGRVLSACAEAEKGPPSLAAFRARARPTRGNKEITGWTYESNTQRESGKPYYRVILSIQRMDSGPSNVSADSPSIAWDGKSSHRGYAVKWLGITIRTIVLSDDAEFVKAINAILDEEVTRELRRCAPPTTQPVKGLKVSVWTDKTEFTLDEPVLVHWKIENVGKTDREILWREWGRRPIFFEIETPGAKKIEYGSYTRYYTTLRGHMQPETIPLQAGGVVKADLDLRNFFFRGYRDPGTYEVTGLYYPVAGYTGEEFLTTEEFKDVIVDRIASAPIRFDIVSTSEQSTEDLSGLRKGMTRASVREYLGEPNMSFGRGRTRIAYSRKNGPDGAPRWLILTFDQRVGNRGDYSTTKLLSWKIVPRGIVTPPDESPGMRKGFVEGYHSGYLHGLRGESEACPGAAETPVELRAAASRGFYTGQYHGLLEKMGVEQGKPIRKGDATSVARADVRVRDAELAQRLLEFGNSPRRVTATGDSAWLVTFYDLLPDDNPGYMTSDMLEARTRRFVVADDGTWVISDPKEVAKYRLASDADEPTPPAIPRTAPAAQPNIPEKP